MINRYIHLNPVRIQRLGGKKVVVEQTNDWDRRQSNKVTNFSKPEFKCSAIAGVCLCRNREETRMVEVEYPAVSIAIARFEKRLKTDRSLEKRLTKTGNEIVEC
jgi:hypothetical protein